MRKVLIFGVLLLFFVSGQIYGQNACDLNGSGVVDSADIVLAKDMLLGNVACTAKILSTTTATCTAAMVQRVIDASLPGGSCTTGATVVGSGNTDVSLAWDQSVSPNITINKVYVGTSSRTYGTAYVLSSRTNYTVVGLTGSGYTYYFAVTAVDVDANESDFSNEVSQTIGTGYPDPTTGTMSAAITNGVKGQVVSVPITSMQILSALQYTFNLPLWASSKATVSNGPVSASADKDVVCKWQKAGLTTVPLKCLNYGVNQNWMDAGVVGYLNIPIPATLSGSFNIGVTGMLGATAIGNDITMTAVNGKVTITAQSVNNKAVMSTSPASATSAEIAKRPTAENTKRTENNTSASVLTFPIGRGTSISSVSPTLSSGTTVAIVTRRNTTWFRSLMCVDTTVDDVLICGVTFNVGPPENGEPIMFYPTSSDPSLVSVPSTLIVEAGKSSAEFEIKVKYKPEQPFKVTIGVFTQDGEESVLFDLWP
jgi:hypothetical protein